jgi:hypothetical protein
MYPGKSSYEEEEMRMEIDNLLGWAIVAAALVAITYLVLWSRSMIGRIANKKLATIREIVKDMKDGRE